MRQLFAFSVYRRPKIDKCTTSARRRHRRRWFLVSSPLSVHRRRRCSLIVESETAATRSAIFGEMEVLKTSQEIVHEGWLIKSPPTKLWRAVGTLWFVQLHQSSSLPVCPLFTSRTLTSRVVAFIREGRSEYFS